MAVLVLDNKLRRFNVSEFFNDQTELAFNPAPPTNADDSHIHRTFKLVIHLTLWYTYKNLSRMV